MLTKPIISEMDAVVRHFAWRERHSCARKDLLVVDEFQTMEDAVKRELFRIHETCGFALVLGGNAERIATSGKKDPVALQQIESRIGARFFLPNLDQGDCELIAKAYGVKDEAALGAALTLGTKGNARELVQTLQMARHGAQGGAVSLSNIREALVLVTGKTDALISTAPSADFRYPERSLPWTLFAPTITAAFPSFWKPCTPASVCWKPLAR